MGKLMNMSVRLEKVKCWEKHVARRTRINHGTPFTWPTTVMRKVPGVGWAVRAEDVRRKLLAPTHAMQKVQYVPYSPCLLSFAKNVPVK